LHCPGRSHVDGFVCFVFIIATCCHYSKNKKTNAKVIETLAMPPKDWAEWARKRDLAAAAAGGA
jgi:hypothetical protein